MSVAKAENIIARFSSFFSYSSSTKLHRTNSASHQPVKQNANKFNLLNKINGKGIGYSSKSMQDKERMKLHSIFFLRWEMSHAPYEGVQWSWACFKVLLSSLLQPNFDLFQRILHFSFHSVSISEQTAFSVL